MSGIPVPPQAFQDSTRLVCLEVSLIMVSFVAEILRANDNLTKVIEDYRRIMGIPSETKTTIPSSTPSTAQTASVVSKSSEMSSNLSSLIDLDMSSGGTPSSFNGDLLSNELKDLGR